MLALTFGFSSSRLVIEFNVIENIKASLDRIAGQLILYLAHNSHSKRTPRLTFTLCVLNSVLFLFAEA